MLPIMCPQKSSRGQSFAEYVLLLVLIAVIVILVLGLTGRLTASDLNVDFISGASRTTQDTITATPAPLSNQQILQDINSRILNFYNLHNSWPRTWSPYNFTDVGLNPTDYSQAINGLYWSPHGSNIGIANRSGDAYEVYVKKLDGTMLHLVNGWSIWCDVPTSVCYYHTIAPGNEVDFSSIVVTSN